jgi:hypothetical protein
LKLWESHREQPIIAGLTPAPGSSENSRAAKFRFV